MDITQNSSYEHLVKILTENAESLIDGEDKYSSLIKKVGDSRFVLMGEATHGTAEFYQARIDITKRLIKEKGFMAVAIEGDWPNTYLVNRCVQGLGNKLNIEEALSSFKRFPTWMWNNKTIASFLQWLKNHNEQISDVNKVGFYGLDLYCLYESMQAVIDYLEQTDPEAASRARQRYACFDHVKMDPQYYGLLCSKGLRKACIDEATQQIIDLNFNVNEYLKKDGPHSEDEYFSAFQNACVVKDAENYYRSMFDSRVSSWNNRDKHMTNTLESIANYLEIKHQLPAKIIVWAHNSHVGDARATEMGSTGEVNIGQLIRETHPEDTYSIGFSTYEGTVTAAKDWGSPGEIEQINPGLEGSYEFLFHALPYDNFLIELRGNKELEKYLKLPRLQRAIGVVYAPTTERISHYFFTDLSYQFDSIIHFDKTTAVN